jgi:flagellar biosynthesis protein FlhF
MQVKRYEVSSVRDALAKIKNDLGPDAIILSVKKLKGGKESLMEVVAARDEKTNLRDNTYGDVQPDISSHLTGKNEDIFTFLRTEINELKESIYSFHKDNSLNRELAEIKETMDKFFDLLGMRKGKAPQDVNQKVYFHLLSRGFSRSSACQIIESVNQVLISGAELNEKNALRVVENYIVKSMPAVPAVHDGKKIKIFIGPTGVGKTTTLAKMAARYSIMKKMKVGLVTTDTFRIAATAQLGTYAKIMGLNMEVASSKETFQKAIRLFSDKDVILVDTPGRGRLDDGYINLLENCTPHHHTETNLLISATASEDNLQDVLSKYAKINFDNLIFTKIDESRRFGILYDVINKVKKPVTYLTCGQNVPQDIEEVTPLKMANLIMSNVVN